MQKKSPLFQKKIDPEEQEKAEQLKNVKPRFQTIKGMHDVLPEDHKYFSLMKKVVRHRARQGGFRRITTPVLEVADLFRRGVGDSTDIVQKEMYEFEDKDGTQVALRPEGTAAAVRAYLEHGMHTWPQPVNLYYIEPFFRRDKPQKGRYRQFWQFSLESIGEQDPVIDAQIIYIGWKILQDLGFAKDEMVVQLNTIGCPQCRADYIEVLKNYYIGKERSLCEDCVRRIKTNPLRLLDCKEEDCQILAQLAPKQKDYICKECTEHHNLVKEYLEEMQIAYEDNPNLVRGLDYYTKTVFEIWDRSDPKGKLTLIGGGRYDGLVELLGGIPTPSFGFSAGMERIMERMIDKGVEVSDKDSVHAFLIQLGPEAKKKSLSLVDKLREEGVKTMVALGKGNLRSQLRLADKFGARFALILGEMEIREKSIIIREMSSGSQETVPLDHLLKTIKNYLDKDVKTLDKLKEKAQQ